MAKIIRGTTPTITYNFNTIRVANITSAYLTIKQSGRTVLEKTLSDAIIGDKSLSWTLTQAETLAFTEKDVSIMVNWLLNEGTRGATKKTSIGIEPNYKEVVIS